jgi:type I restriction enzyme S subunit
LRRVAQVKLSSVNKKSVEVERPVRLCNYTDVYYQDSITGGLDLMQATASDSDVADLHLQAGDVIITKDSESWDDIGVPSYVEETLPEVVCGYHLALLRPDLSSLVGRFLHYALMSRTGAAQFHISAQGVTRYGLTQDAIKNVVVPLPPVRQQRAIAEFLDKKTTGIDQIVEDKARLIERLEEKRQAFIRHAVSRGLDEQRPTRDARLPWLESIPEGWDEVQIRFVARLESGHTPSRSKPEYWAPEKLTVPWVTLADVWQMREARREYIEDTEEMISDDGIANSGARVLPKGTVMLSRTASVGFSGIMARPMATSQDFANWVCGPYLLPEFLLYVFRSMKPEFERLMTGSTHQTIYMPEIRRLMTPLPPREEQEAIVRSLRARLDPLDSAVRDIRTQLDALREYRTSLITAAVTGQVDVRASTAAVA